MPTKAHRADAGFDLYSRETVIVSAKESATIDTGSIVVKLYNHSGKDYKVQIGDKISQIVLLPIAMTDLELVKDFENSERGNNGFGSSGR